MTDLELPVWTIRPNWTEGILESLEWFTDILTGDEGFEQRRQLRLTPRRSFEHEILLSGPVRAYYDMLLNKFGSSEFMFPLWHCAARLTAKVVTGATILPCDTVDREFAVGDLVMVYGGDFREYDRAEVVSIDDGFVEIDGLGVTYNWPVGAKVMPLRRGRLDPDMSFDRITATVAETQIRYNLTQANPYPAELPSSNAYRDTAPILPWKPNSRESLEYEFNRIFSGVDNEIGIPFLRDHADRAFVNQEFQFWNKGRGDRNDFRSWLYALRGRAEPFWLSTYNRDFELAATTVPAQQYIDVVKTGFAILGALPEGRRDIVVFDDYFGPFAARILTITDSPDVAGAERLTLEHPLPVHLEGTPVISFLALSRLEQDRIEINHVTDDNGLAEANVVMRGIRNANDLIDGQEAVPWYMRITIDWSDDPQNGVLYNLNGLDPMTFISSYSNKTHVGGNGSINQGTNSRSHNFGDGYTALMVQEAFYNDGGANTGVHIDLYADPGIGTGAAVSGNWNGGTLLKTYTQYYWDQRPVLKQTANGGPLTRFSFIL